MIFEKIEDACGRWNNRFKNYLLAKCPPGYELKGEYRFFWGWIILSCIYSVKFLLSYSDAYSNLFYYTGNGAVLNTNMRMPGFTVLLDDSLGGFVFGILFLLMVIVWHYTYYRKESRSIYVMKRIGNRRLLMKTYLGTASVYGAFLIITGLLLLLVYYGIYKFMTPIQCM